MKKDISEIIRLISDGQIFNAETRDGAFVVKINRYVPFICTAIHAGSNLRNELTYKIALDEYERWYEEDPYTDDFISSLPITIVAKDSRFEYDLNRPPSECIYTEAWGKKVWSKKLSLKEIQMSKAKHGNYYKILHTLVASIEKMFGDCVVFDIHTYNYKRLNKEAPLFNIGVENLNIEKYQKTIDSWIHELSAIELPNINNITETNSVFFGRGYNLQYINKHFHNTLVLPTEIKKIYCDEETGDIYHDIIKSIQKGLKEAIINTANFHYQKKHKTGDATVTMFLSKGTDRKLLSIDKQLHAFLKNFELLATVNPINASSEKVKFFKSKFRELPAFKYSPMNIDVFDLKQKLLNISLHDIQDISIRNLYEAVINSYFDKIDIIASRGTSSFIYNSLRYFGRPSKADLYNAHYILHLPAISSESGKEPVIGAARALELFRKSVVQYGIDIKVEFSKNVISQILALNTKRKLQIQPNARFYRKELNALIEHEVGVHMVTTVNSNKQRLKVFNLGLPVNTQTQEGLAILAEYLSGNMTLRRLRKFALRTIAVDLMCQGADFIECFHIITTEYDMKPDDAYGLVARIYRGGGFTKDHLYLSGFVKILKYWNDHHELEPLLIGKTSLEYIHTIEEMIERDMVQKPEFMTKSFVDPNARLNDPVYNYILSGLK